MLPLKDVNPTRSFPVITFILILINTVVFFIEVFYNKELIVQNYGISFNKLFYLKDYKTLITYMFLHANFTHLFFNMFYLWMFGNNIEDELGAFKFLLFYMLGGIVAAILQLLFISDVNINLIGASGAVSAILGAYLKLYPTTPILIFIFIGLTYVPAFVFIIFWFIFNLLNLFFNFYSNVAYLAHIAGFIFGFLFIDIFKNLFSFKTKKRGSKTKKRRKYFY
jgi:membrane associated rhomboid family serine protease